MKNNLVLSSDEKSLAKDCCNVFLEERTFAELKEKPTHKFVNKIVGGTIPKEYIPGVQKGLNESYQRGFVAGYPMVDIRATLTFGSFHEVDSSELSFKLKSIESSIISKIELLKLFVVLI